MIKSFHLLFDQAGQSNNILLTAFIVVNVPDTHFGQLPLIWSYLMTDYRYYCNVKEQTFCVSLGITKYKPSFIYIIQMRLLSFHFHHCTCSERQSFIWLRKWLDKFCTKNMYKFSNQLRDWLYHKLNNVYNTLAQIIKKTRLL